MGAGADSNKSVNDAAAAAAAGGVRTLGTVINDANGCFDNDDADTVKDFGLAALAGTNNCAGTGMETGTEMRGASLVFHSSLKYFELFVYIIWYPCFA